MPLCDTRAGDLYENLAVERPRRGESSTRFRHWILVLAPLVGFALACGALDWGASCCGTLARIAAADEPAKPARDRAVVACAAIPVRFNGRVATLDVAASHWLRSLAETDRVVDERDRPVDPLRAWLDVASRHERARNLRIVPIDDTNLLKLLELEPRPAPTRDGRTNLFALGEFSARIESFEKERARLQGVGADGTSPAIAAPNSLEYRRAVDDLAQRLALVLDLLRAFRGPSEATVEAYQIFQRDVQQLELSAAVPAVIAPRNAEERWVPFSTALWDKRKIEITGDDRQTPHPAVDLWNDLLTAWAADDAPRTVTSAAKLVESSRNPRRSPFEFTAPASWIEAGAAAAPSPEFYQDTQTRGFTVASFTTSVDPRCCLVRINYFPAATSDPVRILNHWRFESWLAPLDRSTLERQFRPVDVAGVKALLVETVPPRGFPGESPPAGVAAIVRRDSDLFVLTLTGRPDAVADQRQNLQTFFKGLRLGTPADVARWFGPVADAPERAPDDPRWLAIVAPGPKHAWCFLLPTLGALPADKRAAALRKAAEFVQFAERELTEQPDRDADAAGARDAAARTSTRRVPEGWRVDSEGSWYAFEADPELGLAVRPLAEYSSANELVLGEYLRSLLRLPGLDAAAAKRQWTTEKVGEKTLRVFESGGSE